MGRLKGFIWSTIQGNIQALYILSSLYQNDFLQIRRIYLQCIRIEGSGENQIKQKNAAHVWIFNRKVDGKGDKLPARSSLCTSHQNLYELMEASESLIFLLLPYIPAIIFKRIETSCRLKYISCRSIQSPRKREVIHHFCLLCFHFSSSHHFTSLHFVSKLRTQYLIPLFSLFQIVIIFSLHFFKGLLFSQLFCFFVYFNYFINHIVKQSDSRISYLAQQDCCQSSFLNTDQMLRPNRQILSTIQNMIESKILTYFM